MSKATPPDTAPDTPPSGSPTPLPPDPPEDDMARTKDTEHERLAALVAPKHPGLARDLEVETRAPAQYLRHVGTGVVQAAGVGDAVALGHSGNWEPCDAPDGAPAATGGPVI